MQNTEDDSNDESGEGGGGLNVELLKAYLEFGKQATRSHKLLFAFILATGTTLAVLAATYWPRTFSCTTVLMATGNAVLDTNFNPTPLAGASDLILRHDNLERIVRDTGLIQKNAARRAPILKLKDKLTKAAFGEMTEKVQLAVLVATLEGKLDVTTEKGDLTIKAEWGDPATVAELAEAARQSFVKDRHVSEMSAFEEKMSILNEHSNKLRNDITGFAEQARAARASRVNQARGDQAAREKSEDKAGADTPRVMRAAPRTPEVDVELPALQDKLATLKRSLADMEAERNRRLHEAQAKFDDLKLHLTASHPDVITQGERVAMLAQVPSEMALLQSEVKDVESEIQQREGFAKVGGSRMLSGGSAAKVPSDALPSEITSLLRDDDGDPGLTAQLSSAVMMYAGLRHELLATRIDLDTAQAAFNHRYQVIIPAEAPQRPIKPKPTAIVAIGVLLSLLLALALPVALELNKGVMTERWQVEHQLPVLAELHLPPYSGE